MNQQQQGKTKLKIKGKQGVHLKNKMNELSNYGWCECSKGKHYFHSYDFHFMKIIGHLIDHHDMLKNQHGHSTLRSIAPEYVPPEYITKNNDEEEIKSMLIYLAWRKYFNFLILHN